MAALRTDSALLWDIRRLGGQILSVDTGDFWAIFGREYLEAVGTETRVPVLTCRTSDAEKHIRAKGTPVVIGGKTFKVQRHEPDGEGLSMVYLGE